MRGQIHNLWLLADRGDHLMTNARKHTKNDRT